MEKIAVRNMENLHTTQWWLWAIVGGVIVAAIATSATAAGVWVMPILSRMFGWMKK